jgi:predicted metalloendopeptidase
MLFAINNIFVTGRKYDRNGNMRQWWTNATVDEYVKRSACYIEQYSSYRLVEIDDWVRNLLIRIPLISW